MTMFPPGFPGCLLHGQGPESASCEDKQPSLLCGQGHAQTGRWQAGSEPPASGLGYPVRTPALSCQIQQKS